MHAGEQIRSAFETETAVLQVIPETTRAIVFNQRNELGGAEKRDAALEITGAHLVVKRRVLTKSDAD